MNTGQPDSFDDLVRKELHREWPKLTDEFINGHQTELMEFLEKRKSLSTDPIEKRAREIPDILPAEFFKGISEDALKETESTAKAQPPEKAPVSAEQLRYCIELLTIYMRKVLDGEVNNICLQATRTDGNMEMLFTLPANIHAYYVFMTQILATNPDLCGSDED